MKTDYEKYRGKCKQLAEDAVNKNPQLELVRGWYHCDFWGKQEHWWTKYKDGSIYDPSAKQFPSKGIGEYEEFRGYCECAECGKPIKEEDIQYTGSRYVFCSGKCFGRFVGVY